MRSGRHHDRHVQRQSRLHRLSKLSLQHFAQSQTVLHGHAKLVAVVVKSATPAMAFQVPVVNRCDNRFARHDLGHRAMITCMPRIVFLCVTIHTRGGSSIILPSQPYWDSVRWPHRRNFVVRIALLCPTRHQQPGASDHRCKNKHDHCRQKKSPHHRRRHHRFVIHLNLHRKGPASTGTAARVARIQRVRCIDWFIECLPQ